MDKIYNQIIEDRNEMYKYEKERREDLQARIDKAIEYIEEIWKECENTNIYNITLIGILRACLLKILRGEDNE